MAITSIHVIGSNCYTAWWLYPLSTHINAETGSSECYQNTATPLSGDLMSERKGMGPEGFEPPID
jgi:hypothetical protein